ncbi:unnamed protein product, partial [Meganyctiphanes norvegica]
MGDSEAEGAETEPLVRRDHLTQNHLNNKLNKIPENSCGDNIINNKNIENRVSRVPRDKRPRLSLVPERDDTSSEDDLRQNKGQRSWGESPTAMCPFFGVKNYLHNFYEKDDITNPALYEDIQPEQVFWIKTDSGCSSGVFRLSLILGCLILLLGCVAFVVAACAARRTLIVTTGNGGVSVMNRLAAVHNAQVDALLLVGLVAVTLGSTVVAAALISKTFCSKAEETYGAFRFGQVIQEPPISPIDKKVPATASLTQLNIPWYAYITPLPC